MVARHSTMSGEFENRRQLLSELTIYMLGIFHASVVVCSLLSKFTYSIDTIRESREYHN